MARPVSNLRRNGAIAAAALAAIVLAGWWWQQRDAGDQGGYRTTTVESGEIRVAISATGTLSAISTVTVGSQVSGQVTEVLVDFNDKVEQGQVIARIDPSTYEAQIEQGNAQVASAQAQLRQAQASLRNAELDYQRKAALGDAQLVAKSDIDLARAARDQAQAQVTSAQAQIRQQAASTQTTRVNLNRTVIRSPVDGVVLTRSIEPGQTVAASLQAPELFTIAEDLSQMKIELAVDESDNGQVREGQSVELMLPDGSTVTGTVRTVAPTIDPQTRKGLVYVDIGGVGGALRAGMFASGRFNLGHSKALTVPSSSVMVRDGFSWLFKLGADNQVTLSKVETGRREGDRIEITKGLGPDDAVVDSGVGFLADGDTVAVAQSIR